VTAHEQEFLALLLYLGDVLVKSTSNWPHSHVNEGT
jgi:hypothetical protein